MRNLFKGKKILITGGTGSLGQALLKELLAYKPEVVRVFSRDEAKQFDMQQDFTRHSNVRYLLGDVRDVGRLGRAFEDIDIVFHVAALKHVPACEYNPFEAVKTNILGTQNVIEMALEHNIERVIYTSTDKSISPTNTMGATKMVAERLMSSAQYYKGTRRTYFGSVRFGNVMGSRGSVIPLFKKQVLRGGPVTVTVPEMTRFMMTLNEAVHLTMEAARRVMGGEVFVLKMPVIRVRDLAEVIIEEFGPLCGRNPKEVPIEYIGLRPGEKMYEELMTAEEAEFATEFPDMFAVPPPFGSRKHQYREGHTGKQQAYSSHTETPLTKTELRQLLKEHCLLDRHDVPDLIMSEAAVSLEGKE